MPAAAPAESDEEPPEVEVADGFDWALGWDANMLCDVVGDGEVEEV